MNTIDTSSTAATAANAVANAAAGAAASAGAAAGTDTAAGTEDRFLKLLVAQMRNQEPLNPLDNAQVTSQLAQINTVRGIEQLNASVSSMAAASGTVSPLSAVGLLGRQVLVAGDSFAWSGSAEANASGDPALANASSAAVRLGFELPADAKAVRVEIVDAAGRVVHTHEAANAASGVHTFEWNGRNASGTESGAGSYRLRATAAGYDGTVLRVDTLAPARITGIVQATGGARVELAGRAAQAASAIRAVL